MDIQLNGEDEELIWREPMMFVRMDWQSILNTSAVFDRDLRGSCTTLRRHLLVLVTKKTRRENQLRIAKVLKGLHLAEQDGGDFWHLVSGLRISTDLADSTMLFRRATLALLRTQKEMACGDSESIQLRPAIASGYRIEQAACLDERVTDKGRSQEDIQDQKSDEASFRRANFTTVLARFGIASGALRELRLLHEEAFQFLLDQMNDDLYFVLMSLLGRKKVQRRFFRGAFSNVYLDDIFDAMLQARHEQNLFREFTLAVRRTFHKYSQETIHAHFSRSDPATTAQLDHMEIGATSLRTSESLDPSILDLHPTSAETRSDLSDSAKPRPLKRERIDDGGYDGSEGRAKRRKEDKDSRQYLSAQQSSHTLPSKERSKVTLEADRLLPRPNNKPAQPASCTRGAADEHNKSDATAQGSSGPTALTGQRRSARLREQIHRVKGASITIVEKQVTQPRQSRRTAQRSRGTRIGRVT